MGLKGLNERCYEVGRIKMSGDRKQRNLTLGFNSSTTFSRFKDVGL